jgi:hypothetical protein
MLDSYYVVFKYFRVYKLGIGELKVMCGGEGPYELPPSRGWPCLVENILFLKPREVHLGLYHHL